MKFQDQRHFLTITTGHLQIKTKLSSLKPLSQSKPNFIWKGTSRQRSGKRRCQKEIPTPNAEVGNKT